MKFDIVGRIENMRLPGGQTALLYSIYEAVSNSIHAIEERFGSANFANRGVINVLVDLHEDKSLRYVAISDNGIGLNATHLKSFETCDTRQKLAIKGRGVGRLVWFKAFNKVHVESTYEVGLDSFEKILFEFRPDLDDSFDNLQLSKEREESVGTRIILSDVKQNQNTALSRAMLTKHLCHHFFPYFIAGSMPRLYVRFGRRDIDVGEYLSSKVDTQNEEVIKVDNSSVGEIKISHVYVDKNISQEFSNSILLTAQGRVVKNIEIEKKFALRMLGNGRAYVCVVSGSFLDEHVDQERTGFKADESDLDALKDAALQAAEKFLHSHISEIRKAQKRSVVALLEEHPQLAISVADVDKYVSGLSPGMSDEDIGKTLFTLLYRHEKRLKAQINALDGKLSEDSSEHDQQKAINELVQKVNDDARRRLAEYTIKRHQIIQLARSLLKYSDDDRKAYHWEKALHEIICPMGKMLRGENYDDHNLWLIDDLLSYYSFFASDKAMTSFGVADERKEPDLIFFNPYGFRREGTDDPIVIIEFKRPGDEALSSDPVDQVLDYIERLRNRTVRGPDGEVITGISEHTPFECIVICDLTAGAKKKFERSLAQNPTPDGMGYYGFSPRHKASIRVLSYSKVFRDAQTRNQMFFRQLGLLPMEVRQALSREAAE